MDSKRMERRGLQMQISAMKLDKWVMAGLRKAFPSYSDDQLQWALAAACQKAEGNAYEEDQVWAELVHRFNAAGHTLDSLEA